jgi:hypothetical protein
LTLLVPIGAALGGLALALLEALVRARFGAAPDLAALALALLLTAPPSKRTPAVAIALLLGYASCTLEPANVALLGGGIAATLLAPARAFLNPESGLSQALFGLAASLAFVLSRELHARLGFTVRLAWRPDGWTTPLLTALATPILARAGSELRRVARRSARRSDAAEGEAEPPPSA